MVQATTPTFILSLPETVDLSEAANVYFSLKQNGYTIEKSSSSLTVSAHSVSVYLTQADTIQLAEGTAQVQLNWTYSGGSRACSEIVEIPVSNNLLKRVVS